MTQKMNAPILVLADETAGVLTPVSRQALTLACTLTDSDIVALSVGDAPDASLLTSLGATRILHAPLGASARVSAAVADAIATALDAGSYGLVLLASNYRGREIAGRVAALTDAGAVSGASSLTYDGGVIHVGKSALGGSWNMGIVLEGHTPIVGITSGMIDDNLDDTATLAPIEKLDVTLSADAASVTVTSSQADEDEGISLTDASTVVVGGRGVDGDFELVHRLANALGGAVGATRVACDEGWAPRAEQIGQTGLTISPNLYIGLGVSGAIHHTVGMQSSAHIVAVCDDPDAPIFEIADFGVVGDVAQVVPAALSALEEMRDQA